MHGAVLNEAFELDLKTTLLWFGRAKEPDRPRNSVGSCSDAPARRDTISLAVVG
jgi:hypothetical protein